MYTGGSTEKTTMSQFQFRRPSFRRMALCAASLMIGALVIRAQIDLTGLWVFKVPRGDGTFTESYFDLQQSGATVTGGRLGGRGPTPIGEGSFKGGKLHFTIIQTG